MSPPIAFVSVHWRMGDARGVSYASAGACVPSTGLKWTCLCSEETTMLWTYLYLVFINWMISLLWVDGAIDSQQTDDSQCILSQLPNKQKLGSSKSRRPSPLDFSELLENRGPCQLGCCCGKSLVCPSCNTFLYHWLCCPCKANRQEECCLPQAATVNYGPYFLSWMGFHFLFNFSFKGVNELSQAKQQGRAFSYCLKHCALLSGWFHYLAVSQMMWTGPFHSSKSNFIPWKQEECTERCGCFNIASS